ncbi:MAG: glycosyltransferase family 4 protein [Acidobacteriia bacterium]|nr:glycosyltransferase family 4 protein [Terriglobia bacterium]
MNVRIRSLLKLAGKSERKVAAVFGYNPTGCHAAVVHLRAGAPEIPVWLFTTAQPLPETAALCESVRVSRNSLALLWQAQLGLWRQWVCISVAPWTGEGGTWPLKVAPFLIPPFRALLLNRHGDFLPGTAGNILLHWRRGLWNAHHSGWNRAKDVGRALWRLISYHVWRSGPVTHAKDVTVSTSLLLAATVLRWLSYPDRKLFQLLHGQEPLPLFCAPADGSGVARFTPGGADWGRAELERLVNSSDARWILWQEDGAAGPVDDMLPLFEDPRTFAVSRQASFRGWKAMPIAMAPFRTLQPGEASQVLAPVSGQMLVDRRKLAALGIPRSSLAGTAWLLNYWKAAAAGWRAYSIGPRAEGRRLDLQPDFPAQERAFLFRVLANRRWRCLGPREPDLARGSVAFRPARRFPARAPAARLKVLLVSPFLPYPLSHGGAVRIYNLCRALQGRVDFILATIREKDDRVDYGKLHEIFREVYVLDRDEPALHDERLPGQVREHQSRSLRALVAELARTAKPDLLQIEYSHMAAFRDSAPEVPAILVEHDLTFSLYHQLANGRGDEARREYRRWLAFERHWLGAYDGVWTVSASDREAAIREGRRGAGRTFTVANGVDTRRFMPCAELPRGREILYVGSFRHLPNILGFEELCQEVMPRVWSAVPDARLRVVAGPEPERFWNRLGRRALGGLDKRIEVHGFVEDLRPLYAAASVVVVPLEVSAGTNIKVLEAMACAKAVVTTPVGCAGLGLRDGVDAAIATDLERFAGAVCELLADAARRSPMGAAARRTVEERFTWAAIADSAYESYLTLAAGHRTPSPDFSPAR